MASKWEMSPRMRKTFMVPRAPWRWWARAALKPRGDLYPRPSARSRPAELSSSSSRRLQLSSSG